MVGPPAEGEPGSDLSEVSLVIAHTLLLIIHDMNSARAAMMHAEVHLIAPPQCVDCLGPLPSRHLVNPVNRHPVRSSDVGHAFGLR
jgi:hypothetical protein